ncbi:MAG: SCO family protein [Pseudomonadota bacterium]
MTALSRPALVAASTAGGAVVIGLAAAIWFAFLAPQDADRFAECRATRVAGGAGAFGGPFELTAHTGARVTEAEVFSRPTLLYFGYTWCPDVCPFDVARMAEATEILEEDGYEVTPVFVTIDPGRDDVASLADFAEVHHPRMLALTGDDAEIKTAASAWRVYYARNGDDPEDYLMDHSTFTYLVGPGGEFLDVFRREASSQELATQVACYLDHV